MVEGERQKKSFQQTCMQMEEECDTFSPLSLKYICYTYEKGLCWLAVHLVFKMLSAFDTHNGISRVKEAAQLSSQQQVLRSWAFDIRFTVRQQRNARNQCSLLLCYTSPGYSSGSLSGNSLGESCPSGTAVLHLQWGQCCAHMKKSRAVGDFTLLCIFQGKGLFCKGQHSPCKH